MYILDINKWSHKTLIKTIIYYMYRTVLKKKIMLPAKGHMNTCSKNRNVNKKK